MGEMIHLRKKKARPATRKRNNKHLAVSALKHSNPMPNMKAPLPLLKERGQKTFEVMNQILPEWQAPDFISPNNFYDLVQGVTTQENLLGMKEAAQAAAADALEVTLADLHTASVFTLKTARLKFGGRSSTWRKVTANGGSRALIISEGNDIIEAWQNSGPLWVPEPGKTLAVFQAAVALAVTKFNAHSNAETLANRERGILWDKADHVWDLCVQWYEAATAKFAADTPNGYLIRTIPTAYNPNEVPGQLHFTQHFSPAPNQVKLVWEAARGEHFNLYAKMPGALEFTQIATNVTQTSWMGEGLTAGEWMFKAEAKNASGLGEMSIIITVPVANAMAA